MASPSTPRLPPARRSARCVYCGAWLTPEQAKRWPWTCRQHDDLPARDPDYMLSVRGGQL